jgi:hypothetical protein
MRDDVNELTGWANPTTGRHDEVEHLYESFRWLRTASLLVHSIVAIAGLVAAFFFGAWAFVCSAAVLIIVFLEIWAFVEEKRCRSLLGARRAHE